MKTIEEIDKNFRANTDVSGKNVEFHSAEEEPFKIYGVFRENDRFCRLPKSVAQTVNEGVALEACNTAGGRIRFRTDSPYVVLHAVMGSYGRMPHFVFCGSCGFDIYDESGEKNTFLGSFMSPMENEDEFDRVIEFTSSNMRDIIINMPTYSDVKAVYIGLEKGSALIPPKPYRFDVPVLYYGSSITQGGCSSRPGNTYQQIISRRLNCDYINLGFSGNARAETTIAEYISKLSMSVFVYDYDHNAPSAEYLRATHKPMFDIIRKQNPELPIVMVSRPNVSNTAELSERIEIIRNTYDTALREGDKNVYFINGQDIVNYSDPDIITVDGVHPNDFGFWCMAEVIGKTLEKILK